MQLRTGFELIYSFPQPTPIILVVNIHDSRASDIVVPDRLVTEPSIPITGYRDAFGNQCNRVLAPAGRLRLSTDCIISDNGQPDEMVFAAGQDSVEDLPEEILVFLLGSRYCETDCCLRQPGNSSATWLRGIRACRPSAITFITTLHSTTRTPAPPAAPLEAFNERTGVCRDYAHLAIAFCRCMNIPARYCTGYLSDLGTPPPYGVGDFAAWFEAWIGGRWHTFDPRNNVPRSRPHSDGARPRCVRCRHRHDFRTQYAGELQGLDG